MTRPHHRCRAPTAAALAGASGLTAFALAGCVYQGVQQTALPPRVDYVCKGERMLQVARGTGAAIVRFDGREATLPKAASAAQEKYSDGDWTLYLDGEKAFLESGSRVLAGPCQTTVALPEETRRRPW